MGVPGTTYYVNPQVSRVVSVRENFVVGALRMSTYEVKVQRLSFVFSTSEVYRSYALWNIQNLRAVPPYRG